MFSLMRSRRKTVVAMVLFFVLLTPVYAFVPLVASAIISMVGEQFLVADLVVFFSGAGLTAIIWQDCNKFSLSTVCTNRSTPQPINSDSVQAIWGQRTLEVQLAPDAKRENPDPTKWNDPASGARDVTPKSTANSTSQPVTSPPYPTAANSWVSYTYYWDGCYTTTSQRAAYFPSVYAAAASFAAQANKLFNCAGNASYGWNYSVLSVSESTKQFTLKWTCKPAAGTCPYESTTSTSSVSSANPDPNYVPMQIASCPPGYTLSGSSCNLTDATQVKKPATEPCQILYDASARSMLTDNANPNCADASGLINGGSITVPENGGPGYTSISPNGDGGFNVTKSDGQGNSTIIGTGPYDAVAGGYPITSTGTTKKTGGDGDDPKGTYCGVAGKPPCGVYASLDSEMTGADQNARQSIQNQNNNGKALLDNIDPDKFKWSFIPSIPTAQCVNPHVKNPLGGGSLDVDICKYFNAFSLFLNAVLGVLCLYGCAREVQKAMDA